MAKSQMRSNRETRKPKKDKTTVTPPPLPGLQVKLSGSSATGLGKKKLSQT